MSYRHQFEGQGLPKTKVASLYLTNDYTVPKNNSSLRHQISLILVISPLIVATSNVITAVLVSLCLHLQLINHLACNEFLQCILKVIKCKMSTRNGKKKEVIQLTMSCGKLQYQFLHRSYSIPI